MLPKMTNLTSLHFPTASGLVPLADMYNTAVAVGERNIKCGYYKDPHHFVCWTTRDIKEGEEV